MTHAKVCTPLGRKWPLRRGWGGILAGLSLALVSVFPLRAQAPAAAYRTRQGMVVSQSALASEVGASVLRRGGNAIDAAVAAAFALAVTHPAAGNIGGGGFLVAMLPDGTSTTFDFRERAPAGSTVDMFLDENGEYDAARHHESHLAVGVPGSVAGLYLAHQRLGKLPWRELVDPAIRLAAEGFEVTPGLADSLAAEIDRFRRYPASKAQFTADGEPLRPGVVLRQKDLARSLARVRDHGADGFYRGETADLIVREMERGGGRITHADLADYVAVERSPVRGSFEGWEIVSMPPPSSGGVALVEMLQILEGFDLRKCGYRGAAEVHLLVEAMRRAFADRASHLGDPDFVSVPLEKLLSKSYAAGLRATIDPARASKSSPRSFEWPRQSGETTHLSVVDAQRMAVSLTTTLEASYGSAIVVPGGGFLLNNEMGDFNPRAGSTTKDGLIGTEPNLVAPRKRMLSSMTPTIVARDGKPVLVVGSPGGRTIINTVLTILINHLVHGLPVQEAVDAPRIHHQWLPDRILIEPRGLSPDTVAILRALGHEVVERQGPQGAAMAIRVRDDGWLEAGCDRRRADSGAAGY